MGIKTMSDQEHSSPATAMTRREVLALLSGTLTFPMVFKPAIARASDRYRSVDSSDPFAPISEIAVQIQNGSLSPVELTEGIIGRIKKLDARLNSYVTLLEDQALFAARMAEKEIKSGTYRGPLHGIPLGVKDVLFMSGIPTMGGTMVLRDFVPDHNATVVDKLLGAGAIIVGKNTLYEGAMGPYHPNLKVPVNPWNEDRWSGVSSSGSGVAVVADLGFASIGTDTGCSFDTLRPPMDASASSPLTVVLAAMECWHWLNL